MRYSIVTFLPLLVLLSWVDIRLQGLNRRLSQSILTLSKVFKLLPFHILLLLFIAWSDFRRGFRSWVDATDHSRLLSLREAFMMTLLIMKECSSFGGGTDGNLSRTVITKYFVRGSSLNRHVVVLPLCLLHDERIWSLEAASARSR